VPLERADLPAVLGVPQAHAAVLAGRGDELAVGADGDAPDLALVALHGQQQAAGLGVPEADLAVGAGGGEFPAVGREADVTDPVVVALQRQQALAAGDVPDAGGLVAAGRGDLLAVGRGAGAQHLAGMALQPGSHGAVLPEGDDAVAAGGGVELAVGADGDGKDAVTVAAQGAVSDRRGRGTCGGEGERQHEKAGGGEQPRRVNAS